MKQRLQTRLLALCASVILAACGGGGGGGSTASTGSGSSTTTPTNPTTPTTPVATPTATIAASATSVTAGQNVTLTWSSANTGASTCTASGAWSGQIATSGTQVVTTAASTTATTATYTITCGTASANVAVAVAAQVATNLMQITVDRGLSTTDKVTNTPFVSVTICRPGTTTCQTIDHILLDTGSYGLRLIAPLDGTLALPAVTSSSGLAIGECGQFVSGYTWGSVAKADVKLGGEVASNQSIQIIGDAPGGASSSPSACSALGNNIGTTAALGAKGVLGLGLFKQDCGAACVGSAIAATYYACANGSCSPTTMPLAQQVSNPVAAFANDNNGVIVSFPSVATGGVSSLTGTLTFGIGTQSNNALAGATKYPTDANGHVTTAYKGTNFTASFLDTGSNGIFFNDTSLTKCTRSTDFYCPASATSLTASIIAADKTTATIPFTIESVDALPDSAIAAWIGGPAGALESSTNAFDWGLPFFFGRKVYIGLESDTANPYWAF